MVRTCRRLRSLEVREEFYSTRSELRTHPNGAQRGYYSSMFPWIHHKSSLLVKLRSRVK